jgi:putative ABC transport system permease protein
MLSLTFKNLLANKVRFALTTFGVMLAVSFVVAAFVLGDGLNRSFVGVSEDITSGIDVEVRGVSDFGEAPPLPSSTVDTVAGVNGVADAVAGIEAAENAVQPIKPDGEAISINGPPLLAFNWIDNPQLSAFTMVAGNPPQVGEFTMDVDSAAEHGFVIGDTYEVLIPDGSVELTLSGTSSFGADNSTLGAVLMQMNTAQASDLFGVDGVNTVNVQVDNGADPAAVRAAIAAAVPDADVVDHATVLEETTTEFTDEITVVRNILLGFGGVALFVSVFIIYNTFGIVLSQRTRELALLRTVGADPRQLRRSVLGEALAIGVIASAGGIAGGIGVAKGIEALFGLMGVDLVDYPLIVATRTIVAAALVGIGVTTLAAIGPARRAATVSPIALLASGGTTGGVGSRARMISGVVLFVGGLVAGATGLAGVGSTSATVAAIAFGAMATILGVAMLSPLAVGFVTSVIGWPLRRFAGVAGGMARSNAARDPRRTATTSAALMIGLALVSTALVIGQSVKASVGSAFERSAKADYFVTDELEEVEFPTSVVDELHRSDVVSAAAGFSQFEARVDGSIGDVVAVDFDDIDAVLDLDVRTGGFETSAENPVAVSVDEATAVGASVGDVIPVEFANGSSVSATVVGLFAERAILTEPYVFDSSVLAAAGLPATVEWIAVSIAEDAGENDVDAMFTALGDQYPYASVETAAEFRERIEGMVDSILAMVNVLTTLAVVIALIGIANTMALSVFERTRELGLVRAVGMSRRQLRRMVRYEAALVAVFGATLGVGLGLLFGTGVVGALPASVATGVSVPVMPILTVVLVAAVAGVAAAVLPARRAARLDVLEAIAT